MNQNTFYSQLVRVVLAVAVVLAVPLPALAQAQRAPSAVQTQAENAAPSTAAFPDLPAVPSAPIGKMYDEHLFDPVPADELGQLRADLILLAQTLGAMSPSIEAHNIQIGFTEARINATSDQELTAFYNSIPDLAQFRMAVNSLADLTLHPIANRNAEVTRGVLPNPNLVKLPRLSEPIGLLAALPFDVPLPNQSELHVLFTGGSCTGNRTDDGTNYGLHVARNTLTVVASTAIAVCHIFIEVLGFGGTIIPACAAFVIAAIAAEAINFAIDLNEFCDATISDANLDASLANSIAIHDNLDVHHDDIMTILTEFRQLMIRVNIEENLLQTADLKVSMYQLPEGPHIGVSLARSREIVLDTIQRNQLAGMAIGNAQAEFNAGESLLAQNKFKDAYARYRAAYRAAVNQTVR